MTIERRSIEGKDLAALLGDIEPGDYRYVQGRIPPGSISILPQARKEFPQISELAGDIAQKGLLHPLIVARLDREGAEEYLDVINILWETNLTVENDLISVEEKEGEVFYVLVAGERRFRAFQYLIEEGCDSCQETYGSGGCFERHFPDGKIEVRAMIDASPLQALFAQAAENIHVPVPPYEAARFYDELYRLIKQVEETYPLKTFAGAVGRSESTVRNAMRFCELPPDVQTLIDDGMLMYGIGVEISRLQREVGISNEEAMIWAMSAITSNHTVTTFRQRVNRRIYELTSGQKMMDIFEESVAELRQRQVREAVMEGTTKGLWAFLGYFGRVIQLFEEGKLGREDSPYSEGSMVRLFLNLIERQKALLPHLESLIPNDEYKEAWWVLERMEEIFFLLDKKSQSTLPDGCFKVAAIPFRARRFLRGKREKS